MPDVPSTPFPFPSFSVGGGLDLDPEETKPTIALGVDLAPVEVEPLRDGGLHLGHGSGRIKIDVRRDAVTTVHDEGSIVHAPL